jgi:tetratricopeptide (TPR) repeat protein
LIESGEPAYLVRYEEYETGLDADPELFREPPGIKFEDVEPPTLEDVQLFHSSAVEAQNAGDYEAAESFHRKTLEAVKQMPGYPINERARVMSNLASVLNISGKPRDALALLVPASEILVEHPSQDPGQYIMLTINTGRALALLDRLEEAEVHFLEALSRTEAADAMGTMYGAEARAGYAYLLSRTNRQAEAVEGYQFALDFWSTRLPEDHALVQDLQRELQKAMSDLQQRGQQ